MNALKLMQPLTKFQAPERISSRVILVEPLGRSTGHQSWFMSRLAGALVEAGVCLTLVTFDGLHDDVDRNLVEKGCSSYRVSTYLSSFCRWIMHAITGVLPETVAAPSSVRNSMQMRLYSRIATTASALLACQLARRGATPIVHLLCPPSLTTVACVCLAAPRNSRLLFTAFASPGHFRGSRLLVALCRWRNVHVSVQTSALADGWAGMLGKQWVHCVPLPSGGSRLRAPRDESRRVLDLPVDKPLLAIIGCISPQKGYVELYRAIRTLPKRFRILLVGDTPAWMVSGVQKVVHDAGWLDATVFRPQFVPEHLMPSLFGAVDAVALLYRDPDGSSGILSCCREYQVPVLATAFGEIGASVRRGGLGVTVDPDDTAGIQEGIANVLSGRPSHTTPVGLGFTWAEAAQAHLEIYSKVLWGRLTGGAK